MSGPSALRRIAAAIYIIAAIVLVIKASDAWWSVSSLFFILWVAAPVVAGFRFARYCRGLAYVGYLVVVTLIALSGFAEQWRVMFVLPPDAQSAIILVVVPVYQWLAIGLSLASAWLWGRYAVKS